MTPKVASLYAEMLAAIQLAKAASAILEQAADVTRAAYQAEADARIEVDRLDHAQHKAANAFLKAVSEDVKG